MNKNKGNALISFLFYLITIALIIGILFFLIIAFKEDILNGDTKIVAVSEDGMHEIKPILPEDDKEDSISVVTIDPIDYNEEVTNNYSDDGNDFYYTQIDSYSKMIYDALKNNKDNLKTGTYKISISKDFAKHVATDEGSSRTEMLFTIAVSAFENDNPDVFYVDYNKMVLYYQKDFFGNCDAYISYGNQSSNYLIDGFNSKEDVKIAEEKINSIVQDICNNCENRIV